MAKGVDIVSNRYNNISICKGIAIILMVLGHTSFSKVGNGIIYMFHMPLFIFMSGYCFKEKYIESTRIFITNKLKRLYIPFVIWSIAFIILHNLFYHLNLYNGEYGYNGSTSHLYSLWEAFRHLVHVVVQFSESEELLGGFWFLKSLFWGSLIAYGLLKAIRCTGLCCMASLVASLLFAIFNINIPFFDIAKPEIYSSFFFLCGKYYKEKELSIENKPVTLVICSILVVAGSKWWWASLNDVSPATLIPYSISALCGTLFCLGVSNLIAKYSSRLNKTLSFVGDNTLDILALHFISFKLVSLLIIKLNNLEIAHLAEFPNIEDYASKGWWVAYLFAGVLLPLGFSYLKNRIKKVFGL